MERWINFEKIKNARDLGRLHTVDSRIIHNGLIYRSGHLRDATSTDLKMITDDLKIGLIIDLRTIAVRDLNPDRIPAGVDYQFLPILEDDDLSMAPEGNNDKRFIDPLRLDLTEVYVKMINNERCRTILAKVIKLIMTHDYRRSSVLFHCSGGKDRTGVVAAILLMILGVSKKDVISDYMLTNESKILTSDDIFQMSAGRILSQKEIEAYKRLFFADEDYINAAINAIYSKYNTIGGFTEQGLGIEKSIVSEFKEEMLV